MITDVDDFCLRAEALIDDMRQALAARRRRPGMLPACRDSELLAMRLTGECRRWNPEPELLSPMPAPKG